MLRLRLVDTERLELSISACKADVIPFHYAPDLLYVRRKYALRFF